MELAIIDDDVVPIYSGSFADLPAVIDVLVDDQAAAFHLLVKSTGSIYDVTSSYGEFDYMGDSDGWEMWDAPDGRTYGNLDGENITVIIEDYQDELTFQFHLEG